MFVFGVWGVCDFVDVVNRLMCVCCVRLTTPTTYTRKPQTPKPKPQRDNNADPNAAAAPEERLAAHKAQLEDKIRQLAVEHGIDPNDVRILSKEVCEDWVDGWVDGYMIMYRLTALIQPPPTKT